MAKAAESPPKEDHATIKADVASLMDAVEALVSEGTRSRSAMAKTVKRSMKNASAAGADILDNTWNLGEDSAAAVANAAQNGASIIETQLKKNPLGIALVAFGVGLCIGLFRFR